MQIGFQYCGMGAIFKAIVSGSTPKCIDDLIGYQSLITDLL